jgi:hypothetical protein
MEKAGGLWRQLLNSVQQLDARADQQTGFRLESEARNNPTLRQPYYQQPMGTPFRI